MNATAEILSEFEQYALNPTQHAARLRVLLEEGQTAFFDCVTAARHLDLNNRGYRFALLLLRSSGRLIPFLASPSQSSMQEAVRLAKLSASIDTSFGNELLASLESNVSELQSAESKLRILDILLDSGIPPANWRIVSRLTTSEDSRVRARAIRLLALHKAETQTIQLLYKTGDARSRADLVEAVGGDCLSGNEAVFRKAVVEENNRAAANACWNAYRANDVRSLAWLEELIAEGQALSFRISAAWAIAQTRDPRFTACLLGANRSAVAGSAAGAGSPGNDGGVYTFAKLRAATLRALTGLERLDAMSLAEEIELARSLSLPGASPAGLTTRRTLFVRTNTAPEPIDWFLYTGAAPVLRYEVIAPGGQDLSLRIACAAESIDIVSKDGSTAGGFSVGRVAGFGAAASISLAAKSLLKEWEQPGCRMLVIIPDPRIPMDLDLASFHEQCKTIGCELVMLDESGATAADRWSKFAAILRESYRIQFEGSLANLSLRIRSTATGKAALSEALKW